MRRAILAGVTAGALLLTTTACGDDEPVKTADGKLSVVAGFYPLEYLAERLGAEGVAVSNLTQAGAEPHDLELKPSQIGDIGKAALVVYLSGFQPAVDEAVKGEAKDKAFDVAAVEPLLEAAEGDEHAEEEGHEGEEHAKDPHVWLDPIRYTAIAVQLADRLVKLDPANADAIKARADQLRTELQRLDEQFTEGLKTCARRDIVTSHGAFGYLAARYKLNQIPIAGLDPEAEPNPQRVQQVAALAKEKGVTTIFFESLVSPKLSETVAKEIGVKTAVLDPIEGVEGDATYVSVMVANLAALREALGCS